MKFFNREKTSGTPLVAASAFHTTDKGDKRTTRQMDGEICKYFGIDKVEESICHCQENLLRDILDIVTHYVTRYSLSCDVLNY